jgi:ABC-type multidrug transport system permease subunit
MLRCTAFVNGSLIGDPDRRRATSGAESGCRGFMFPFGGMPLWAQWIGEIFPTTHAMRIVRGVLIKGNAAPDILPDLWPMALFMTAVVAIAIWCYRETLE